MPDMPTLGEPPKTFNPLPGVIVTAVLVGTIGGGAYWWSHRQSTPTPLKQSTPTQGDTQQMGASASTAPVGTGTEVAAPAPGTSPAPVDGTASAAPATAAAAPSAALPSSGQPGVGQVAAPAGSPTSAPSAGAAGLKSFSARINGPLESTVVAAVGKATGAPLTQVINRTLVWWLKVPGDLVKGDELSVVYEERERGEPVVHAVRFNSGKLGKTLEAYRFKPDADAFARAYTPDGAELEQRLVDGPLDDWEQITSLLKDGRRHQGVDFKTPVGTPVKATFDGTVARKSWAFRRNGNSLEIVENGGKARHALYLHLSEISKTVAVGQRVKRGQVIAQSGNTGHSFAPHLHYQMTDSGGRVIDPFDSHQTTRRSLDPKAKGKLDAAVARLRQLLDGPATMAGGR